MSTRRSSMQHVPASGGGNKMPTPSAEWNAQISAAASRTHTGCRMSPATCAASACSVRLRAYSEPLCCAKHEARGGASALQQKLHSGRRGTGMSGKLEGRKGNVYRCGSGAVGRAPAATSQSMCIASHPRSVASWRAWLGAAGSRFARRRALTSDSGSAIQLSFAPVEQLPHPESRVHRSFVVQLGATTRVLP